jgi:hypothetical protein
MRSRPKKPYKESVKQEVGFLKRLIRLIKLLVSLTRKRRENTQINKIKDKRGI